MHFRFSVHAGINDLSRGAFDIDRQAGQGAAHREPGIFLLRLTEKIGVSRASRTHQAGTNGGDENVVFGEFRAKALTETHESELACRIGKQVRGRQFSAYGGDVHDAAVTAALHAILYSKGGVERAPKISLQGVLENFEGLIFFGADDYDTGVVHQNIDRTKVLFDGRDGFLDLIVRADIARESEEVAVAGTELFTHTHKFGLLAGADGHAGTASCKLARQRQTQSPRPASDE